MRLKSLQLFLVAFFEFILEVFYYIYLGDTLEIGNKIRK